MGAEYKEASSRYVNHVTVEFSVNNRAHEMTQREILKGMLEKLKELMELDEAGIKDEIKVLAKFTRYNNSQGITYLVEESDDLMGYGMEELKIDF